MPMSMKHMVRQHPGKSGAMKVKATPNELPRKTEMRSLKGGMRSETMSMRKMTRQSGRGM